MKSCMRKWLVIVAVLVVCRPAMAAGGAASPAALGDKLCAAEKAADPEAVLALVHPQILEGVISGYQMFSDDPRTELVTSTRDSMTHEPVQACEVAAAREMECPQEMLDEISYYLENAENLVCGELDLKLTLKTSAGKEDAHEIVNLLKFGDAWYIAEETLIGREYVIVLPEETPQQKADSLKELDVLGASVCNALTTGDVEKLFSLMHPSVFEFIKVMIEAFGEEGVDDPWAKFIADARVEFQSNPVTECTVAKVERTECDMEVLQGLRSAFEIRATRCGRITFGQSIIGGGEEEPPTDNMSVFSDGKNWYTE